MKNIKFICLLICNLITFHTNASELINNKEYISNLNINESLGHNNNDQCEVLQQKRANIQSNYLSIKNNNLNCALISLIHCLNIMNKSNLLISQINNRYKELLVIQQFCNEYPIDASDVILALDNFKKNTDNNIFKELIECEHNIAKYIIEINKLNSKDDESVKEIRVVIQKLFEIKQRLNCHNTENSQRNNANNDIKSIFSSNNDPNDTLNSLIKAFNNRLDKINNNTLQQYTISSYDEKINTQDTQINSNNFILDCNSVFLKYIEGTNYYFLNLKNFDTFIENIKDLNNLCDKKVKNNMFLEAIVVVFYNIDTMQPFHYASIVRTHDNEWLLIDSDKQHDKDSEFTLYNSLQKIFNKNNDFYTQNVPDECLKGINIDNNIKENNKLSYKLLPAILFYKTDEEENNRKENLVCNNNILTNINNIQVNNKKENLVCNNNVAMNINDINEKVNNLKGKLDISTYKYNPKTNINNKNFLCDNNTSMNINDIFKKEKKININIEKYTEFNNNEDFDNTILTQPIEEDDKVLCSSEMKSNEEIICNEELLSCNFFNRNIPNANNKKHTEQNLDFNYDVDQYEISHDYENNIQYEYNPINNRELNNYFNNYCNKGINFSNSIKTNNNIGKYQKSDRYKRNNLSNSEHENAIMKIPNECFYEPTKGKNEKCNNKKRIRKNFIKRKRKK